MSSKLAENIVGIGKPSKVSECFVARDPCDPPGRFPEAIVITRNNVTLKWKKPAYDMWQQNNRLYCRKERST